MPDKKQSILLGSAVGAVLSTSYLGMINCLCCAGIIAGAMVAVWHYTTNNELTISAGTGASMGAIVGIVAIVLAFFLNLILIKVGVRSDLVIQNFILDQWGDSMPPEAYDQMVEQMNSEMTFMAYLKGQWIGFLVGPIFGALGGVIGAAMFKKGQPEDLAGPAVTGE